MMQQREPISLLNIAQRKSKTYNKEMIIITNLPIEQLLNISSTTNI